MNKPYTLLLFTSVIIASGCATITVPADDMYMLQPLCDTKELNSAEPITAKALKISTPKSTAAIMSRDLLYQQNNFMQLPYAYSHWNDTPNNMLTYLFAFCASNSLTFKTVLPPHSSARSDYLLESTIHEFHHHINPDGTSEGRVIIEFYLLDLDSNEIIANRSFSEQADAQTTNAQGGVEALNAASNAIALDLSKWLSSLIIKYIERIYQKKIEKTMEQDLQ